MIDPESPNGKWARLGCTIERTPRPGMPAHRAKRTIRRPDGSEVAIKYLPGEDLHAAEDRTASAMLEQMGGAE